jgi:hypothetical protein
MKLYKEIHPNSIESDSNSLASTELKKNNLINLVPNFNGGRVLKRKLMTYRYGKRSKKSSEVNDDKLDEFIENIKSHFNNID